MNDQNNKKPIDKKSATATGPTTREEINGLFDKLDKESLDAVVKNVQAELDKRAKLVDKPPSNGKKGRIAKIYVPLTDKFNERNSRAASEIAKTIAALWGKPEDKVEIIHEKHGRDSDGANLSISIRGEGSLTIHPSLDFKHGPISRAELSTMLGYTYGNTVSETTKKKHTSAKPESTPAKPQEWAKKAVLVIGTTPNAKARAEALKAALVAKGYIVETVESALVDPAVDPRDLKISLYDYASTYVHAPHQLHKTWRLEDLVKAIQDLDEKHTSPTKADPKVVKVAETSGIPADGPLTTKKAEKPLTVRLFTPDNDNRRKTIMAAFCDTWNANNVTFAFDGYWWNNHTEDFVCTIVGDMALVHKEFDERHETAPVVVKISDLAKYLKDKHFPKAEEPRPVDIFALPKSRYVSLVHQYCVMDDEIVKQFQREIYEATGEVPDDFSLNTSCHSDTVVTVGVLGNSVARVFDLKNPNMLKSSEHKVYFNEVAGKVKEILDASGVPYAKAKKPEQVTAEEPTKQYVYIKKRQNLPNGEAYSECVSVAMSKKQKLRVTKLAQEKHRTVGNFLRETVLTALKID